jgi:hypothetical protein
MSKHTILFLAANPRDTDWLALDREARSIREELERSGHRDQFEFETRWAAESMDLLRELRRLKPAVLHYSGHGGQEGLFFQTPAGEAQVVSAGAIAQAIEAIGTPIKLVVLNACYSDVHADELLPYVDCVVGVSGSIPDDKARAFAIGFYGGLGENESVGAAYKQGCAAISLEESAGRERSAPEARDVLAKSERLSGESARPHLRVRRGTDADRLFLGADPS